MLVEPECIITIIFTAFCCLGMPGMIAFPNEPPGPRPSGAASQIHLASRACPLGSWWLATALRQSTRPEKAPVGVDKTEQESQPCGRFSNPLVGACLCRGIPVGVIDVLGNKSNGVSAIRPARPPQDACPLFVCKCMHILVKAQGLEEHKNIR